MSMPQIPPTGQQPASPPISGLPPLPGDGDEMIKIYDADPFDARPSDPPKSDHLLKRALAAISTAFSDAAGRIRHLFSRETESVNPLISISRPRNWVRKPLPDDLQQGLDQHHAERAARVSAETFVKAPDPETDASDLLAGPDRNAFDSYLALCAANDKAPGQLACPQNFREGALRHAQSLLDLTEQRKQRATDEGREFTLLPSQQQRLKAAATLLTQPRQVASAERATDATDAANAANATKAAKALEAGPVATHTAFQYQCFEAWREWRDDTDQPMPMADFSISAATAYAQVLVEKHGQGTSVADPQLHQLLADANSLIDRSLEYQIFLDLLDLRKPVAPEPAKQPPPVTARTGRTKVALNADIPDLSSFDPADQVMGTTWFNEFIRGYASQIMSGTATLERDSRHASALCVAAANDFLRAAVGPPTEDGPDFDPLAYAAANFLLSEYRKAHAAS